MLFLMMMMMMITVFLVLMLMVFMAVMNDSDLVQIYCFDVDYMKASH